MNLSSLHAHNYFFQGGTGFAKNITYEQIILQNVRNPIFIDQAYDARVDVHISLYTLHYFIANIMLNLLSLF